MEAKKLSNTSSPPAFQIALCIRHPNMDPEEISRQLQLEGKYSFKAGEPRRAQGTDAPLSFHSESYWLGELKPTTELGVIPQLDLPQTMTASPTVTRERLQALASRDLDVALSWCSRFFLRTHAEFLRRVQAEEGEVHLLVTLSPQPGQEFTLTPQLGRVLNELGMAMKFELANV